MLGLLDLCTGSLRLASAGHDPPYVLRAEGLEKTPLPPRSLPLGVDPDTVYRELAVALDGGEALVVYTDGITEAETAGGEQFGEARLEAVLEQGRGQAGGAIAAAIEGAVTAFRGAAEPTDDLTLLVLRRVLAPPGSAGP